jgi:hypothetical protein
MKKFIIIALGLFISTAVSAQLKDLMKKKILYKSTGSESTETNKTPADSTRPTNPTQTQTSGTNSTTSQQNNAGWGGMGSKKDISAEYTFQHNIHIDIESFKKDGKAAEKMNMIMYLSAANKNMSGVEMKSDAKKPNDKIISVYEYDKKQSVMYMHSDGKKNVMVSKYNPTVVDTTVESKRTKFTKTGNVKTILTYKCEEWIGIDEKGTKYNVWVTSAVSFEINEYLKNMAEAQKKKGKTEVDYSDMPKGMMMEMTSIEKDGDKTLWKVTAINKDQTFTVKTNEYEYMGF